MGQPFLTPIYLKQNYFQMKKIYTTKYSKLVITLERGGVKADVEFKNGRMNENVPARFITSDKFLQYMIEKDPRFGSLFRLEKVVAEPGDNTEAEKAAEAKKQPAATVVNSVTDLTEAIDYFSSIGKVLTTEKQVKATMKSMNIAFPNWKQ